MQTQLTQAELDKINLGKVDLQHAELVTGVDWRLLAGIWYRENSLSKIPPSRIGSIWQFDPPLSSIKMQQLLNKYTTLNSEDKKKIIQEKGVSFRDGAVLAACFLREKVSYILDVRKSGDLSDDIIGNTLYSYNGHAYGSDWHDSPYVYNNGDLSHLGLKMNASLPGPNGRIWIKKADTRLGSFVVYRQLKEKYPRQVNPQKLPLSSSIPIGLDEIIKQKDQDNKAQETISLIDGKINKE